MGIYYIVRDSTRKNSLSQKQFRNHSDDDSWSRSEENGNFVIASSAIRDAVYLLDISRHRKCSSTVERVELRGDYLWQFSFHSTSAKEMKDRRKSRHYRSTSSLRADLPRLLQYAHTACSPRQSRMRLCSKSVCGRNRIHGLVSVAFEARYELCPTIPHACAYTYAV